MWCKGSGYLQLFLFLSVFCFFLSACLFVREKEKETKRQRKNTVKNKSKYFIYNVLKKVRKSLLLLLLFYQGFSPLKRNTNKLYILLGSFLFTLSHVYYLLIFFWKKKKKKTVCGSPRYNCLIHYLLSLILSLYIPLKSFVICFFFFFFT